MRGLQKGAATRSVHYAILDVIERNRDPFLEREKRASKVIQLGPEREPEELAWALAT